MSKSFKISKITSSIITLSFKLILFCVCFSSVALLAQTIKPEVYKALPYRYIGPPGNRIISVTGIAGDPLTYYAGAASGGVFKTIDGGIHWTPVSDKLDVSSIGALAVAPSDNQVVWAGTGETFIRSNISVGNGIYKSTDGGRSWKCMGLKKTGRIGRIVIDPRNPDVVFAAALGHCYGPQQDRGVYRTQDGGRNWERVLFVDEKTGCSDIAMDPNNPRILFAGMWQIEMSTWQRRSGGSGSGLFVSRDGGDTWKKLKANGLPKSPLGKVGVAIAPSNSDRIYALIETDQYKFKGVLFRSDDGGRKWKLISHDQQYTQRPHYYTRCVVSPIDEDEVYFLAHGVWKSVDGGKNAVKLPEIGGDDHDMWIDPLNSHRMIVGNDFTAGISQTHGKSWHRPTLPNAQMYHVEVDSRIPYNVYGNRQDGPTFMGPSNSRNGKVIHSGQWHDVGGFECGFSIVDPVDNNIVWAGGYDGLLTRYNLQTGHSRTVTVWPDEPMGWAPADLKFRWNWTFPIVISPHDHNRIYVGSQYVHQSEDGGESWTLISPDLTTNDKSRQVKSGGLTIDNIGVDYGCTLFALAESKVEEGLIWAGSNDGLLHITRDGGKNWTNVSNSIKGMPDWGIISNIEPSRFNAAVCYIAVDAHRMNDRNPYVFKTGNYGKSWQCISKSIPSTMLSYAHCIREDPVKQGMLYLGTENAIYWTPDYGKHWMPLQNNLPHVPVHWLVVQEHFNDLVVGTYGRGFWILDDITPLRTLYSDLSDRENCLFKPRDAYRFQEVHSNASVRSNSDGKNPPYGACIHYYFKVVPKDSVILSILDGDNKVIRKIKKFPRKKGINRFWWDLRHDRAVEPKLRTAPLGHPGEGHGPERLRYGTKGWRPLVTWGQGGFKGPRVKPGQYTVQLLVGDSLMTQPLTVRKDPNTESGIKDASRQVDFALKIRDAISETARMINQIEWIRRQIDDLQPMLKVCDSLKTFIAEADSLDKVCINLEKKFFQLTLTGTGADDLRGPTMLYSKLMNLANGVQRGDFAPTTQQIAVYKMYADSLVAYKLEYKQGVLDAARRFNEKMREKGVLNLVIPGMWK
ncbi:sialidase [bacterium]|nr:sialidase [bacterium]